MLKLTIKEWSASDRPREKLLSQGEQRLSDAELLAVLLRTGVKGLSALDLAKGLIRQLGSLRSLAVTDLTRIEVKGLGPAKTAQIKAAFELGRRAMEEQLHQKRPRIQSAKDVADFLAGRMRDLKVEVFKVLYLDGQNRIIAIEDAAQGTVNQVTPIIREILHRALMHYATAIICAHNHPSGSLEPSREDRLFTEHLRQACGSVGLKLLDHVIISAQGHHSIAAEGLKIPC